MRNMPNTSYTPQEKAQHVTMYNETASVTTVREKIVHGTKEMHHIPTEYLIGCETSNCEEMWKIKTSLEDLQ